MKVKHTMQDEAAIRQIVKDIEAGWNNKDGYAYARSFAEDADFRNVWGFKASGRDAIAQGHQHIFENQYRNTRMELHLESLRFVRPDVAHLEVRSYLQNIELPFECAVGSAIVTKTNDMWQILSFNNAGILPE